MAWRKVETPGDYSGENISISTEIVVQTNDKKEYVLPRSAITLSKLLNDLLQDAEEDSSENPCSVPLANVDAQTFGMLNLWSVGLAMLVGPFRDACRRLSYNSADRPATLTMCRLFLGRVSARGNIWAYAQTLPHIFTLLPDTLGLFCLSRSIVVFLACGFPCTQ